MTRSALTIANRTLIPTILEAWPVEALDISSDLIQKARKSRMYLDGEAGRTLILPTFYEERRQVTRAFHYALRQGYDQLLSNTIIHRSVDVTKTYSTPGARLAKNTRAYEEYAEVVDDLVRSEM